MDVKQLIEFLGHSSIYEPLEDFLLASGIKKRPKGNEGTVWVRDKERGISMEFNASGIYDDRYLQPKRSEGKFVLESITFEKPLDSGLPYGLAFDRTPKQTSLLLGQARGQHDETFASYFFDGKVVLIRWNDSGEGIKFIRFRLPNVYDKENLAI